MRPIAIGLAAALLVAAVAGGEVSAQRGKSAAPDPKVAAASKARGMAEAPAIVAEAGVACQVVDARLIGENTDKKTKITSKFFEVDCAKGLGFVLQAKTGEKAAAYTCVDTAAPAADGSPNTLACILPGNADMLTELTPMMTKAGFACAPTAAKGIGQTPTNTFIEVSCPGGVGYVLQTSAPFDPDKPASAVNCLAYDEGSSNIKCTLGDMASRMAVVDRYAAEAKNGCAVKDRRYIGASQDNSSFFEVSCQDGKGYILKAGTNGTLAQTYECAKATNILGGCTLTDAREAATAQAGLYTRLSKAVGFNCDVAKYAVFPAATGKDVVELVCASGEGGVGVFEAGGKGVVHDCGHALVAGYRCGLNAQTTGHKALTQDLRKFNAMTCEVSEARLAAKTTKGTILLEVACSDGLKGYMIEYNASPVTAVGATNCAFSGNCKLKGNV